MGGLRNEITEVVGIHVLILYLVLSTEWGILHWNVDMLKCNSFSTMICLHKGGGIWSF